MHKQFLIYFFGLLLVVGCKKNVQKTKEIIKKPEMSVVVNHKKTTILTDLSKSKINNWKEYNEVNTFLTRFENTSPNDALNNALELKDLSKNLKDSIRIEDLKIPSFKARLNVFENEALRLADMTYIPAITPKEINQQIDKLFLVFNSVNAKINTFFVEQEFDEDINLDDFFILDSSKTKKKSKNMAKELE